MAYIYPEQAFKSGEVMDPRDFNRNAAQYASEISQLDRDNIQADAVTSAKLAPMSITSGGVSASKMIMNGPCNRFSRWISDSTQTISDPTAVLVEIDNIGGTISTLDSVLVVELSLTLNVVFGSTTDPTVSTADRNHFQVYLEVDGIQIETTGELACATTYATIYLCGSIPVGAGDHSVKARIRGWGYLPETDVPQEFDGTISINERELIVREKRR